MRCFRVVAGGVIICGYLFASGMFGGAAAQSATAEPVGQPMQLLQLLRLGNPDAGKTDVKRADARARAKLAARRVAKSSVRSAARSATKTRLALRRTTRPHVIAAEQNQHRQQQPQARPAPQIADAAVSDATSGTTSNTTWPAAPTAMAVDATTLAPAPPIVAPVAAAEPSELVVDGQTVQVASADEANEIDLAANDASVAASDPSLSATAASDAANADSTGAAAAAAKGAEIGSTSWLLQVMAALGGAVMAGSVAWFLIGSAPQRTYG